MLLNWFMMDWPGMMSSSMLAQCSNSWRRSFYSVNWMIKIPSHIQLTKDRDFKSPPQIHVAKNDNHVRLGVDEALFVFSYSFSVPVQIHWLLLGRSGRTCQCHKDVTSLKHTVPADEWRSSWVALSATRVNLFSSVSMGRFGFLESIEKPMGRGWGFRAVHTFPHQ